MKKLNLLLLAAAALLSSVSCRKQIEIDPTGEDQNQMRYYVGVGTAADTRLEFEGNVVKWSEGDELFVVPIVKADSASKEGFSIDAGLEFKVDMSTLSSDGRSVKFAGPAPLEAGKTYKAFLSKDVFRSSIGGAIAFKTPVFKPITSADDMMDVSSDLRMISDRTTVVEGVEPAFRMRHLSTIVDIEISVPQSDNKEYEIEQIVFSNDIYSIISKYNVHLLPGYEPNQAVEQNYDHYYMQNLTSVYEVVVDTLHKVKLSKDKPIKLRIAPIFAPIGEVTAPQIEASNFVLTVITKDKATGLKTVPAKALLAGRSYRFAAEFTNIEDRSEKHRAALVELFNATGGENWGNNDGWNTSASPLTWKGVVTDAYGEISALELNNNGLVGTLPASLATIESLQAIYMVNNQLSGSIPEGLVQLPSIVEIAVGSNQLTGELPRSFEKPTTKIPLIWLRVENNLLSGTLPENLGTEAPYLQSFTVGDNNLEGNIPDSYGSMPLLGYVEEDVAYFLFNVLGNKLSGRVSDAVKANRNFKNWMLNPQQTGYGLTIDDIGGGGTIDSLNPGGDLVMRRAMIEKHLVRDVVEDKAQRSEVAVGQRGLGVANQKILDRSQGGMR